MYVIYTWAARLKPKTPRKRLDQKKRSDLKEDQTFPLSFISWKGWHESVLQVGLVIAVKIDSKLNNGQRSVFDSTCPPLPPLPHFFFSLNKSTFYMCAQLIFFFCCNSKIQAQCKNSRLYFSWEPGICQLAGFTYCQRKEIEAMCQVISSRSSTSLALTGRLVQKYQISTIMCKPKMTQW